jgi:hypothetical protein
MDSIAKDSVAPTTEGMDSVVKDSEAAASEEKDSVGEDSSEIPSGENSSEEKASEENTSQVNEPINNDSAENDPTANVDSELNVEPDTQAIENANPGIESTSESEVKTDAGLGQANTDNDTEIDNTGENQINGEEKSGVQADIQSNSDIMTVAQ